MKTLSLLLIVLFYSCSSRDLNKNYSVLDASHEDIPEWVSEPYEWAEDEQEDFKDYKYFVFNTEPKNSRVTACEIAKLRVNSEIAAEITQFIKHSLSSATEGDPMELKSSMDEYIDETLTKEVQSYVVGSQVVRKYWEKRKFNSEEDKNKELFGYTCSVLVKISKDNTNKAFDLAFKKIEQKFKKKNLKAKIKEAKAQVQKEFL